MLLDLKGARQTYGFGFSETVPEVPVQLRSVGWERRDDPEYDWDGRKRGDPESCLFQYTLSGEGRLQIGGREMAVRPGEAFLVHIPGEHRYFFSPRAASHWEFMFVMFYGRNVTESWKQLQQKWGNVVKIGDDAPPVRELARIYRLAAQRGITDGFAASSLVYRFLMECFRKARGSADSTVRNGPQPVQDAVRYVEQHYARDIGLEDLARAAGLSKYHFARLFRRATGFTPTRYIAKVRIEKAVHLLNHTEDSVGDIGRRVGFSGGNYFCKVFRKMVGTTPERFRSGKDLLSADEWRLH